MSVSKAEAVMSEDVLGMVKALKEASQELPKNAKNVESLVEELKRLEESGAVKDPKLRRKLLNFCNLMEPQLERARKLASRRGLRYYISRAKGKVLGNDISNVANAMESEINLWLDRQNIEHLLKLLDSPGCKEKEIIDALGVFEAKVKEGYNSELQDVILSLRVFESLTCMFSRPESWSPRVLREAAFALAALVLFNKDVFVSQVLMLGVVENLLSMVKDSSDLSIGVVSVIGSLVTAGKGAVVDEIHAHGGVRKIVGLLEDKREEMSVVAIECVFEIVYYGQKEVIEAMLEDDIVGKLAHLEQSQAGGHLIDLPMHFESKESSSSLLSSHHDSQSDLAPGNSMGSSSITSPQKDPLDCLENVEDESENGAKSSRSISRRSAESFLESVKSADEQHYRAVEEFWRKHPFASAVSRFAIQVEIGQGLRKREKRALKQEILKRVRQVAPSDGDVATIYSEVLWGP
ncbi:hypothetical protein SUGI_0259360 [Cryptomeria japonica]|uniref:uncharacterized protein LOC131047902 n=1 Tax=Cryptomeria japonica TaxID=3369 RepID=UPI002408D621|nr:uncharacterized protein LOC131047902 [Cryptomeria japonica]GLJ15760.1 hypothetical protein SUGI_0259360 [Cryptomeria japonica]